MDAISDVAVIFLYHVFVLFLFGTISFDIQVNIMGQPLGELGTLAVDFDWPNEVENGKWLLYLTKIVVSGQSDMECNPSGNIINPLNVRFISGISFNCLLNYTYVEEALIRIHI